MSNNSANNLFVAESSVNSRCRCSHLDREQLTDVRFIYLLIRYTNHLILFHREFAAYIFQPLTPEFWIVWVQKNRGCILFAVPGSMQQKLFSRQGFHLIYFEILQEF